MQERGAGQDEGQYGGYSYEDEDVPRRSGAFGPGPAAPAPRGPRTWVVVGAVVVAAALGVGAFAAWHASNSGKDDPTVQAGATVSSVATSPSSSVPTSAAPSSPATSSSASPTAASPAAGPLMVTPAAAAKVGGFYGLALAALVPNGPPETLSATTFTSSTVAAKYWDSAKTAAKPAALCGAATPTEALVAGGGDVVNVSFYVKGALAAQEAHVAVDPKTGRISSITCAAAVPPSFVGTTQIVKYFADASAGIRSDATPTTYAPSSADGPQPWINYDTSTCSQYGPQSWILYAPIATTSGAVWRFDYDATAFGQDVFVDPTTGSIERTLCQSFPAIPAPDKAAAGKAPADGGWDPAESLVARIFSSYIMERSQVSHGAVPVDEIAPYFDSAAAYTSALGATPKLPFLCATKAPIDVDLGSPKVSGSTETFELSLTRSADGMPSDNPPVVGKEKIVVDLTTMKIKSLTCG